MTVEFFRSEAIPCTDDGFGEPIYDISKFHYGETTCGLICSVDEGPFSPMREGSADNIYVVPAPKVLTFGAATLLAAGCCIPAVLSLVTMWDKIVRTNWKERFGEKDNEIIEGTNGATVGRMKNINEVIRGLLSFVEVPVFGGAVLALIVVGEKNFLSKQLKYQTEPMENIGKHPTCRCVRLGIARDTWANRRLLSPGQWAPIIASGFAACGSLYMLLAEGGDPVEDRPHSSCTCACHARRRSQAASTCDVSETGGQQDQGPVGSPRLGDGTQSELGLGILAGEPASPAQGTISGGHRSVRERVKEGLGHLVKETVPADQLDNLDYQNGKARTYPLVPGEGSRDPMLNERVEAWEQTNRDADDGSTPRVGRSRQGSVNGSSMSGAAGVSRSGSASRTRTAQPATPQAASSSYLEPPRRTSREASSEVVFAGPPSADGLDQTVTWSTVDTIHDVGSPPAPTIVVSSDEDPGESPERSRP